MQGRVIPKYSQESKVQEALHKAGVSHNAGVVANLSDVFVSLEGTVYFCTSRLAVMSQLTPGDGEVVPNRVTLGGNWEFPAAGCYDIHNVRININGTISIIREAETEVVRVRHSDAGWYPSSR